MFFSDLTTELNGSVHVPSKKHRSRVTKDVFSTFPIATKVLHGGQNFWNTFVLGIRIRRTGLSVSAAESGFDLGSSSSKWK